MPTDTFIKLDGADATSIATDYANGVKAQTLAFDVQRQIADYLTAHPAAKEDDVTLVALRAVLKSYEDEALACTQSVDARQAAVLATKGYGAVPAGNRRFSVATGEIVLLDATPVAEPAGTLEVIK